MLKEKIEKGMASQEEVTSWEQSLENQVRGKRLRVYMVQTGGDKGMM